MKLNIKKLHPDAKIIKSATETSAGYDLYALEDAYIREGLVTVIKTGIAIEMIYDWHDHQNDGSTYEGLIRSRSGLAVKHGIFVLTGTIDMDYRGELCVVTSKVGSEPYFVAKGERIAQIVFSTVLKPTMIEVEIFENENTERGTGGFGSSGKH